MALRKGERLGDYEIVERIGAGGMAVVYRATSLVTGEAVALKVLTPRDETEHESVRRFTREGRIHSELAHARLVRVLDRGSDDENAFLALELVDGPSLASILKVRGELPLEVSLEIGCAVAEGLAYLHGLDVVHRDLKPGNILVSWAGDVKIADFGLARSSVVTAMTATNQLIGTVTYLAPEVVRGAVATAAADLHAVGLILYECLSGRLPYQGSNAGDWIRQIVDQDPRPLCEAMSALPEAVCSLVDRLLSKDPALRPDAAAVREALARLLVPAGTREEGAPAVSLARYMGELASSEQAGALMGPSGRGGSSGQARAADPTGGHRRGLGSSGVESTRRVELRTIGRDRWQVVTPVSGTGSGLKALDSGRMVSDDGLVLATAAGDRAAFESLVKRHQETAWRVAWGFLGDRETARDVVQTAFLKVLVGAARYRPVGRFKAYLRRIVVRLCLDARRRRREPTAVLSDDLIDAAGDPATRASRSERAAQLRAAMDKLPASQRMAISLRYFEGMGYREISEALGTTVKAVEHLLARGREGLQSRLDPGDGP